MVWDNDIIRVPAISFSSKFDWQTTAYDNPVHDHYKQTTVLLRIYHRLRQSWWFGRELHEEKSRQDSEFKWPKILKLLEKIQIAAEFLFGEREIFNKHRGYSYPANHENVLEILTTGYSF